MSVLAGFDPCKPIFIKEETTMAINKAATIAFSPCGSTEKVTQLLTAKLSVPVETYNLTLPDARKSHLSFDSETLVFISFPVYGGLPGIARDVFACLQGNDTPCVYVAVRGDTEPGGFYHSMNDLAQPLGFRPVAAVAAVAEHTLMPTVSHARPNKEDAQLLGQFGLQAYAQAEAGKTLTKIPGERSEIPDIIVYPFTDADVCIRCGQCVDNCPAGAIPEDDPLTQDNNLCICCSECAHVCPVDARTMGDEKAREMLHKAATETFKDIHLETRIFL